MLAQRDADYSLHVSALNTNSTFMETGPIWSLVRSMKKGGKQKAEGLKVIVIDNLPLVFLTFGEQKNSTTHGMAVCSNGWRLRQQTCMDPFMTENSLPSLTFQAPLTLCYLVPMCPWLLMRRLFRRPVHFPCSSCSCGGARF
jgi:hypothetical protein